MNTDDPIIQKLRALKPKFKNMKIKRLRVFGSYARGEAGPDSDLDLLVDFDGPMGLIGYAGVKRQLEEELKVPVDLVREYCLHEKIKRRALNEAQDV